MTEGFDVGLEMSGNGSAFKSMIDTMVNGGRIAMLGIFPDDVAIDWGKVIFKGLFLKGIYGREMFETWYKMAAMIESGLDISPGHHPPLPHRRFPPGLRGDGQRQVRKGHPGLGRQVGRPRPVPGAACAATWMEGDGRAVRGTPGVRF